jgi:hypothetical protein
MLPEAILPNELRADAWCGEAAIGPLGDESEDWGTRRDLPRPLQLLASEAVDLANWKHSQVGWGIVLPERADVPGIDKSAGADAPEPIRALLAARAPAPVLRYDPSLPSGKLRRYDATGKASDLSYTGIRGTGPNAMPRYLLIVASPEQIPWSAQYRMQISAFVGRLDLDLEGLQNYVHALLNDWSDAKPDARRPVVWAVDHGHPDITRLMRKVIADRVQLLFAKDPDHKDVAAGFISDKNATQEGLRQALLERSPAFIITSSHGATFPLDDPTAMRAQLGLPIDDGHNPLDSAVLTTDASGYGAIWYAHACCSAGSDAKSKFEGLAGADSKLGKTLSSIAKVGACSAPLPRGLLGNAKPVRAFIGHVEPTFDWTLRDPATGQVTTHDIVNALYNQLHLATRPPIGLAMSAYFQAVGGLLQDHIDAIDAVDEHKSQAKQWARSAKLMALDRLATVLLGDPTVALPHPGAN